MPLGEFQGSLGERKRLDRLILGMLVILFSVGLFFLFFAYLAEGQETSVNIVKSGMLTQILAFGLGFAALLLVSRIDSKQYLRHMHYLVAGGVILMGLLATPLGIERNSATRWLDLGFINFQPSEIVKIIFIIFFAGLLSQGFKNNLSNRAIVGLTVAAFLFLGLIAELQPDYGTAVIVSLVVVVMMLASPITGKLKSMLLGVLAFAFALAVPFLPDYVRDRFDVFYNINFGTVSHLDQLGDAYHSIQNSMTVSLGGLSGLGPGSLSQRMPDIPEITTDSIFALVAAEVGFLGSAAVIVLFLSFFFFLFNVAHITKDPFQRLMVIGIATLLATQTFVNILVVLGFPQTGVPLLFFSRGGSSLLVTMLAIGIIRGVLLQRKPTHTVNGMLRRVGGGTRALK